MVDKYFRLNTLADFIADLDDFTDLHGYPSLTRENDEGERELKNPEITSNLRFDFDYIHDLVAVPAQYDSQGKQTAAAITRGPHINVRISLLPDGDPAELTALESDLDDFFAALSDASYNTPAAMLDRLGISTSEIKGGMKATARMTGLIRRANGKAMNTPEIPKQVFAGGVAR